MLLHLLLRLLLPLRLLASTRLRLGECSRAPFEVSDPPTPRLGFPPPRVIWDKWSEHPAVDSARYCSKSCPCSRCSRCSAAGCARFCRTDATSKHRCSTQRACFRHHACNPEPNPRLNPKPSTQHPAPHALHPTPVTTTSWNPEHAPHHTKQTKQTCAASF